MHLIVPQPCFCLALGRDTSILLSDAFPLFTPCACCFASGTPDLAAACYPVRPDTRISPAFGRHLRARCLGLLQSKATFSATLQSKSLAAVSQKGCRNALESERTPRVHRVVAIMVSL